MSSKIIVISGIDGSGKTSIIEGVRKEISSRGHKSRYVWLRYNHYLTKFILAFCRVAGYTKYHHFEKSRVGYHDFKRSKIVSWLFVISTLIDTFFASAVKVIVPSLFSNTVIVCDRWVVDIMIDLEVDTGIKFSENCFISKLFRALVPTGSQYFLIMREKGVVRKERDESLNDRNFDIRYSLFEKHAKHPDIIAIGNDGTLDETIGKVTGLILL